MQSFNFGLRQHSANPSMDDNRSRYVPSSVYSGPGPAEESPAPVQSQYGANRMQGVSPYPEVRPEYTPIPTSKQQSRYSSMLNTSDPVAMHLLMETAIIDSRNYQILSFEELEQAKKEVALLRTKLDGSRRQLALESKMRDAAQSLNRLYSTRKGSDELHPESAEGAPRIKRKSLLLATRSNSSEAVGKADDEFAASNRKVAQLTEEISILAKRLEDTERRVLQHTAGILQMTHRGLKKNIRKNELPRSPESMASQSRRSLSNTENFDERSLYQVPDYIHSFSQAPTPSLKPRKANRDTQAIDDVAHRLHGLSQKLHGMVLEAGPHEHFEPPPDPSEDHMIGKIGAQIQAYLGYVSQGLDAMAMANERHGGSVAAHNMHLDDVNARLQNMLDKTATNGQNSPIAQEIVRGGDMHSQLVFSNTVLDRLNGRVDTLVEQKDILTRQIQQQRELNTKSDAQRDAQIRDLTEELGEAKHLQNMAEQEVMQSQNQISLLMEHLDRVKQDEVLLEQQRGLSDNKALESERQARKESERNLMADLKAKQDAHTQLQADHAKAQNDFELRSQFHIQQVNELETQLAQSLASNTKLQEEFELRSQQVGDLEEQVAQLQAHHAKTQNDLDSSSQQYIQQINGMEAQLEQLQADHTKAREDLNSQSQYHTQQTGSLQSQLAQLQADYSAIQHDFELHSQMYVKQVGELESQAVLLRTELTAAKSDTSDSTRDIHAGLQAGHAKLQNDYDILTKEHAQQVGDLESQVAKLQTELTFAKAELDAAYGTRAQRAADVSMNPAIQKEIDTLHARNAELLQQLQHLSEAHETKGVGSAELQNKVNALQKELKDTIEDYEVMTKASIDFEKERDELEANIDTLRDRCEILEAQLSEEKLRWLGVRDKTPLETTSTMVLKNEFKKMMRDSRTESMKAIRAEQDERRKLEAMIRNMKREMGQIPAKPLPRVPLTTEPLTTT